MIKGKIIKSLGGFYTIDAQGEEFTARAKGNFRHLGLTPMVGDWVNFRFDDGPGQENLAYIESVEVRKNQLLRPPVANIDQVFILVPLAEPSYNLYLLDLLLVHYAIEDLPVRILFTKADLNPEEGDRLQALYRQVGYPSHQVNLKEKGAKDFFYPFLKGKTTALAGVSAAGKSTFTNLYLEKELATGSVSGGTKRGRHTTRHVELYPGEDLYILDTPGFSRIEMDRLEIEDPRDLDHYFIEFRPLEGKCKFLDCQHLKEPGCQIKEGLAQGLISEFRYENYVRMYEELEEKEKKKWRS